MKNFKIWFCISLLFIINNLNLLIDDYYLINYILVETEDDLFDNKTNLLLCTSFNHIKKNDKLDQNITETQISSKDFLNYSISSIEFNLKIKRPFELNQSLVFNDFVCFYANESQMESNLFVETFIEKYPIRIYAFSRGKVPYYYDYLYNKQIEKGPIYLKIHKQKIFGNNYLKSLAKCSKTPEKKFESSRFYCLNKCFRKSGINFGLHNETDTTKFNLSQISKKIGLSPNLDLSKSVVEQLKITNRTIRNMMGDFGEKNFRYCISICPDHDCFFETYNVARIRDGYYKEYLLPSNRNKFEIIQIIYLAYFTMGDFEFWIAIFSLITLVTGSSVVTSIPPIIFSIVKKLKENNFEINYYSRFKKILILISVSFLIFKSLDLIRIYNHKLNYPNRTISLKFKDKIAEIVLCSPIEIILFTDKQIKEGRNEEILNNYTINQIIKLTEEKYSLYVEDIVIGDDSLITTGKPPSKTILFKNDTYFNKTVLMRCFHVNIEDTDNKRFKNIIPINYFKIITNYTIRKIYLIEKIQQFSSKLNHITGEFLIGKYKRENSIYSKKYNCTNYKNFENLSCFNRYSCIEKCITKKYYEKYKKVTQYSVFYREDLNLLSNSYFDTKKDDELEIECSKMFTEIDCIKVEFYETMKISSFSIHKDIVININYEKILVKEFEQSIIKLMLDIVNLDIIFFSTNAMSIFSFLIFIFNKKLKWKRINSLFILAFSLIGFTIHNYLIFTSIKNEKLVENEYFSQLESPFELPNIIFCLLYRNHKELDPNHILNGNYLEEMSEFDYEDVFSYIYWFNKTDRIFNYELKKLNREFGNEIEIRHFYFQYFKCFEIELKVLFEPEDFYLIPTYNILGIYFNPKLDKANYLFLLYRDSISKQFSEGLIFSLFDRFRTNKYFDTEIMFESLQIEREDKFETLKNPNSIFKDKSSFDDGNQYLNEMKKNFKDFCNLTSREIFLDDNNGYFSLVCRYFK